MRTHIYPLALPRTGTAHAAPERHLNGRAGNGMAYLRRVRGGHSAHVTCLNSNKTKRRKRDTIL